MRIEHPAAEQLPQLKKLWREAFGEEEDFMEAFFSAAYAPQRCRVVTEGNTVAAMVHWLDGEYLGRQYAYLYAVATKGISRQGPVQRAFNGHPRTADPAGLCRSHPIPGG